MSGKTPEQLSLEIDTMLHDFHSHMLPVRKKNNTSVLRALVTIPLGVTEELLHLRPKGALYLVFDIRDRKANLLEAEVGAPGHEVALLDAAERRFGD